MLRKVILVVGIVCILLVVAMLFVYNKPHQSVDKADELVDAKTLVTAFDENEEDANKRFLDKVLEVKGKVKEVIEQENTYILLLGDDGLFSGVSCTLAPEQDSVAYGLKAGDEVVVRGICTGFLLDVVLVNCKVVNEEK